MSAGLGWLGAGLLVGLASAWTLAATVGCLTPPAPPRAWLRLTAGAALRWILAALLLVTALHQGLGAALWAGAGLWLARWAAVLRWTSRAGSTGGGRLWKR